MSILHHRATAPATPQPRCWVCKNQPAGRGDGMCAQCARSVRDTATRQAQPGFGVGGPR